MRRGSRSLVWWRVTTQLATGSGIDESRAPRAPFCPASRRPTMTPDSRACGTRSRGSAMWRRAGKMGGASDRRLSGRSIMHASRHGTFIRPRGALCEGPRPADEALRTLDGWCRRRPPPPLRLPRAKLLAMLGRFDEAWPVAEEAERASAPARGFARGDVLAEIAALDGDHVAAAGYLRQYCERSKRTRRESFLST